MRLLSTLLPLSHLSPSPTYYRCYAADTCNSKGIITLSQRGWAPAAWDSGSKPTEMGDDGVAYDPTSETEAHTMPNRPLHPQCPFPVAFNTQMRAHTAVLCVSCRSEDDNSPWIQTNVLPVSTLLSSPHPHPGPTSALTPSSSPSPSPSSFQGNPVGRFEACKAPQKRCLCDGVYWYPTFLAPGTEVGPA